MKFLVKKGAAYENFEIFDFWYWRNLDINLRRKFVTQWSGKVVENAAFLTDEEKENILANNVFEFVGRNRADFDT